VRTCFRAPAKLALAPPKGAHTHRCGHGTAAFSLRTAVQTSAVHLLAARMTSAVCLPSLLSHASLGLERRISSHSNFRTTTCALQFCCCVAAANLCRCALWTAAGLFSVFWTRLSFGFTLLLSAVHCSACSLAGSACFSSAFGCVILFECSLDNSFWLSWLLCLWITLSNNKGVYSTQPRLRHCRAA